MKRLAASVFVILLGCHNPGDPTPTLATHEHGPLLRTKKIYCLDGSRQISETHFTYTTDSLKLSEVELEYGFTAFDVTDSTAFEYDSYNRLEHRIRCTFDNPAEPYARTYDEHMEYSGDNLVHTVGVYKLVNGQDSTVSDIVYAYSQGKRISMTNTTTNTYGFSPRIYVDQYIYTGELMTTKRMLVDGSLYRTTNYFYGDSKLAKEEDINSIGTVINTIYYYYNPDGLLITDMGDDTVNKYFYQGKLLTEQQQTYSGIDPNFRPCSSNYKMTFEY